MWSYPRQKQKVLGQEYGRAQDRIAFLRDNCDAVEDLGYVKQLKTEEIEELKDRLVENNIQLRDVRADKKAANKEFNDTIKQLEESNDEVTGKLKERSEFVTEPCYKFIDEETREVGYYNDEGVLVYSRPARPDECQRNIFKALRTGTEG